MNGLRDELFSRASLAQQEHSRISAGDGLDHLQRVAKTRTSPNDPFETALRVHCFVDSVDIKRDLPIGLRA